MNESASAAGELEFLHVDSKLLVVNKPSGLLSVPGRGPDKQDCLLRRVQAHYTDALTVHRLDMSTSGLMMLARGKAMERALSILFQQRQVAKSYVAVVAGQLRESVGEIVLPLLTDWPNRPRQKVDFLQGKPSQTRYRRLCSDPIQNTSRVELEPLTGRSHQLRVHLQQIGHPILGDDLYAPPPVLAQSPRLLLHAQTLAFIHPHSGEALHFYCPAAF
ncbi:MAG: pseudouridine synthase [Thiolinea sp.]